MLLRLADHFFVEFGGVQGAQYFAFLQDLMMSILFIDMYWKRGSMKGRSILLAVTQWIGTVAPTILMGWMSFDPLVLCCGVFCSVFDLINVFLLLQHQKKEKA